MINAGKTWNCINFIHLVRDWVSVCVVCGAGEIRLYTCQQCRSVTVISIVFLECAIHSCLATLALSNTNKSHTLALCCHCAWVKYIKIKCFIDSLKWLCFSYLKWAGPNNASVLLFDTNDSRRFLWYFNCENVLVKLFFLNCIMRKRSQLFLLD